LSGPEPFDEFLRRIPQFDSLHRTELARYFVYFLTMDDPASHATPTQVAVCFRQGEVTPWDDVRFYLSKAVQKKDRDDTPLLVHTGKGYRLERKERERIRLTLSSDGHRRETETALRGLVGLLSATAEQSFLDEAVKCYEVSAYRAAIVMTWNLAIHHLYEYVLKNHVSSFNAELGKVKDKRVKVAAVTSMDDFADIPENKFIEIARAANIISNDVRKILDQKLGTRNSYAHPSTLTLSPIKASEFIQDLINNVVLRYKL
jgi:hypothetical protein